MGNHHEEHIGNDRVIRSVGECLVTAPFPYGLKIRRCVNILNFDTPPAMFFCLNELMAAAVAASAMSVAMFIAVVMVASASATVGGL